jgi:hypothetical protein
MLGYLYGKRFGSKMFEPNLFLLQPSHTSYLPAYEDGTDSVPRRRHIKFRRREITQKKAYNIWIVHICFTRGTTVFNHTVPYFIILQLTSNTVSHFSYKVSDWRCSQTICLKETCHDIVCDFTDKITHISHIIY